jgi:hypothetical protein
MVLAGWVPGFRLGGAVDNLPGFKDGGGVDGLFATFKKTAAGIVGGVKDFFTDPAGTLKALLNKLIEQFPDKSDMAQQILGMPKAVLNIAVDKVKDLFNFGATTAYGHRLAGVGDSPGSGPSSGPGFPPWPSSPAAQRGDSGVWRSIVDLIRSTGPVSGAFGNSYRPGDPLWHGSGRAVDWMGYNQDALASFLVAHRPLELIHRTDHRDYAYTRGQNRGSFNEALMQAHRNHVHIAMDSGGWLEPGLSMIYNGTGAPEPVLTSQQWQDINVQAKTGGDSAGASYHFQFRDTTLDPGKLRALQDREAALARQGRAH